MLTRQHLIILRSIQDTGTLTKASTELHLTQSALTHQIKKLEAQLGTEIWRKEGRKLKFTQTGDYLLNFANRLLPQFEHAESQVKLYADGLAGSLKIGMECHPCYRWFLQLVQPYWEKRPNIDLDVKQKFQFGGLAALLNYDIDLLITPDPVLKKQLDYQAVFDYEQVLVTSSTHPLALGKRTSVKATDLATETLITYPVQESRLDIFNQFLQPANILPKKHKHIESTDILLAMVAANKGVAALPKWLITNHPNSDLLHTLRLGSKGVFKSIHIGYRKNDTEIPHLNEFIDLAKEVDQ